MLVAPAQPGWRGPVSSAQLSIAGRKQRYAQTDDFGYYHSETQGKLGNTATVYLIQ
jgi:hypothetical protein